MRKVAAVVLAVILTLCLVVPTSLAAEPAKGLETGSLGDLTVLKLPADLAGGASLPTAPGGEPGKPPWAGGGGGNGNGKAANKWAVVVGIADYQGTTDDLWHPDEDAKEMKEALIKYGFPKSNIKVLLNKKATAQAIVNAIRWLAENEDADSTVVFFFSGHGFRVSDSEGFDDDAESDLHDEGIVTYDGYGLPDGRSGLYVTLGNEFANFDTQKFALIFGSCHSGGMFDDDDLQASGRVICSACKADQFGYDYFFLGNTLFGYYFVDEGILHGLAEGLHVSGDGVSMEEALDYAYPRVTAVQPDSQPQIYDGYDGELIL